MPKDVTVSLEELLEVGLSAKNINFLPNKKTNSILSGRHSSKLRGRGMDFLELKAYVQGDETKNIDWRATRRSNKTYVRVFNEERDRCVYVVLSQQSNMFFGSQGSFKSVQAARLASVVVHTVLHSNDRVGAVLFDDEEVLHFKASKSKKTSMNFLKEIERLNNELLLKNKTPNPKMFNKALDFLMTQLKHDDLVIIIGDASGLDEEAKQKLTHLSIHNDIIGAVVYDPMEKELPTAGTLLFRFYKAFIEINSNDNNFKMRYNQLYNKRLQELEDVSLMHKIPLLKIATDKDLLLQLNRQLGFR